MEHPIQHYFNLVEEALTDFKIDPAAARGQGPGQWNLRLGSANVWVDIIQSKDADGNPINYGFMQVMAPICDVPVNNQHIFTKELLEANHTLFGVGFTIYKEKAYIKSFRELQGLDKTEVKSALNNVGLYADEWDDKLKTKYAIFAGGSQA
jgi:hypothetical protein